MSLISLHDINKDYGTAHALRGVNCSIDQGAWVSIMGPSGSGKSTLLNIIGGLDRPSAGTVTVAGADINALQGEDLARFRRNSIGFIFQQSHLIPYLTAAENVMLAQYFHSMPDRVEAEAALVKVGLGHRLDHRPSQLSGGEQQRVCIARAMINSPGILLADEPTGNLDRANTGTVLDLLQELHLQDGFTIIVVTHDPAVARRALRVLSMEDGRIIADEPIYR